MSIKSYYLILFLIFYFNISFFLKGYYTTTINPSRQFYNEFEGEKECNRNAISISAYPANTYGKSFDDSIVPQIQLRCNLKKEEDLPKILMVNRNPFYSIAFDYLSKYLSYNFNNFEPLEFAYFSVSMARLYKKLWKNDFYSLSKKYKDNLLVINVEDLSDPFIQVDMLSSIIDFLDLHENNDDKDLPQIIDKVVISFNEKQVGVINSLYNGKNKNLPYLEEVIKNKINNIRSETSNLEPISKSLIENNIESNRLQCSFLMAEKKKKMIEYFRNYKLFNAKSYKSILFNLYNPKLLCYLSSYLSEELKMFDYDIEVKSVYKCPDNVTLDDDEVDKLAKEFLISYNPENNRKYYKENYVKIDEYFTKFL